MGLDHDMSYYDDDEPETVTLELTLGEASALSYFIAYAALNHAIKGSQQQLTPHEESMVQKVSELDPNAYEMWRGAVMRAMDDPENEMGVPEAAV